MNYFKRSLLREAWDFEKDLSKQKWDELVKIVKASDLEIKEGTGEKGMMVGIYGVDDMDIEVSHDSQDGKGIFAFIQIWYHPNYGIHNGVKQPKSVSDALECIDEFIQAIEIESEKRRRNKYKK